MIDVSKLFNSYYRRIVAYANSLLKNEHDAEDVAMSVFEAVLLYPDQVAQADNVEAYLIQMTKHAVARFARDQERYREVVKVTTYENHQSPEYAVLEKEVVDMVSECIARIRNENHRKACYFFHIESATYLQIADKMNVPRRKAQSFVRQGTNKLREIIAKEHRCLL